MVNPALPMLGRPGFLLVTFYTELRTIMRIIAAIVIRMMRWLCTVGILMISASVCHGQMIKHAECETNGTLQLVYDNGTIKEQPKEPHQVGCDSATIADDRKTVGWSVLVENCCTSYPIPLSVAVVSHGRRRIFCADQMVWAWSFVSVARRLAILSGPVHGNAGEAILYDVQSGHRLASWNGSGKAPSWAFNWKEEFGPA